MKTKLTLNINSSVIEKAKKKAANKKTSLSAIVEDYLYQFSGNTSIRNARGKRKTITQRIKEITKPVQISDSELKAAWHKHLEEKYGK
jgi:replicative DNA helicase